MPDTEPIEPTTDAAPLLQIRGLTKHYPQTSGNLLKRQRTHVRAVDGVDLTLRRGETLGLVGESGCGKSTLSELVMALQKPTAGEVIFDGTDVTTMNRAQLRQFRRRVQIIFQDPYASLNPRMTVGDIVTEAWEIHRDLARTGSRKALAADLLERVGLEPDHMHRYPHEFSGGQRQRIGIARALAVKPDLIVCDEPVSALDVSVQAQVINLLTDLQEEFGLAYLFIAHDLSVVRHLSDRVAVMYLGRIVETGTCDEVYRSPAHPYTQALLSAVPIHDPRLLAGKDRIVLTGDAPSPASPPSGCRFRTRCWKAKDLCAQQEPPLIRHADTHPTACHFAEVRPIVTPEALHITR